MEGKKVILKVDKNIPDIFFIYFLFFFIFIMQTNILFTGDKSNTK